MASLRVTKRMTKKPDENDYIDLNNGASVSRAFLF